MGCSAREVRLCSGPSWLTRSASRQRLKHVAFSCARHWEEVSVVERRITPCVCACGLCVYTWTGQVVCRCLPVSHLKTTQPPTSANGAPRGPSGGGACCGSRSSVSRSQSPTKSGASARHQSAAAGSAHAAPIATGESRSTRSITSSGWGRCCVDTKGWGQVSNSAPAAPSLVPSITYLLTPTTDHVCLPGAAWRSPPVSMAWPGCWVWCREVVCQ